MYTYVIRISLKIGFSTYFFIKILRDDDAYVFDTFDRMTFCISYVYERSTSTIENTIIVYENNYFVHRIYIYTIRYTYYTIDVRIEHGFV